MTTSDAHVTDLFSLDREVARGAAALVRWRDELARDAEAAGGHAPLEAVRRVTGKATYDALGSFEPSLADVPLRDALRSWVVALLLARVVHDEDVELAKARGEARGRFAGEPPALVSFRQAWRAVAAARTVAEARLWLATAAECGPEIADVARRRADKRLEAVRRLGLSHPGEIVVPTKHAALRSAAERLLDATQDLSDDVLEPLVRDGQGPAAVLHAAVGREAGEGWPARLGERWLHDCFGAMLQGLRPVLPALPEALGASSFARALGAMGFAVRDACVGKATPFVLGHDPGSRASHRLGAVFAGLAGDVDWQTRTLGIGRRAAGAQARVLGRTALVHVRLSAARLLLGDEAAFAPRDRFEELGGRVLGASLDGRLRGAWPAARDDEASRFVGLLEAYDLAATLRDRFDVDWVRNPKAWAHLRATSSLASREPLEAASLDAAATGLARALEAVVG
jgi:hypothetical protein